LRFLLNETLLVVIVDNGVEVERLVGPRNLLIGKGKSFEEPLEMRKEEQAPQVQTTHRAYTPPPPPKRQRSRSPARSSPVQQDSMSTHQRLTNLLTAHCGYDGTRAMLNFVPIPDGPGQRTSLSWTPYVQFMSRKAFPDMFLAMEDALKLAVSVFEQEIQARQNKSGDFARLSKLLIADYFSGPVQQQPKDMASLSKRSKTWSVSCQEESDGLVLRILVNDVEMASGTCAKNDQDAKDVLCDTVARQLLDKAFGIHK
jgi:hypothetical protein